jgi:hypothetical protein
MLPPLESHPFFLGGGLDDPLPPNVRQVYPYDPPAAEVTYSGKYRRKGFMSNGFSGAVSVHARGFKSQRTLRMYHDLRGVALRIF